MGRDPETRTMTTLTRLAWTFGLGGCLACAGSARSSEQETPPSTSPADTPPAADVLATPPARCQTNADCSWEPGPAVCVAGTHNPTGFLDFGGDHCSCEPTTGQCQHIRFEPVPCQSDDDCAYGRDPVLHPTRATAPRDRVFRPCEDGEVDSVCGTSAEGRYCRVKVWDC